MNQHTRLQTIGDPWVANSLMQKAIRRGDAATAEHAALSFHSLRGSAIWRRLMIIAFEDVGIGSIEALIETVEICSDPKRRKMSGGNGRAIATLTSKLANAVKDRTADHLVAIINEHPSLEATRRHSLTVSERLSAVCNAELPLTVRSAAAWSLATGPANNRWNVGPGFVDLMQSYRTLGISSELMNAVQLAAERTREPFVILLPLIFLAAAQHARTQQLRIYEIPPGGEINGIPLYAFDMHTRVGREALNCFARQNSEIADVLAKYSIGRPALSALFNAAFHVDAAPTSYRLEWKGARRLEALGIETNLLSGGLKKEGHRCLIEAVTRNLDQLNDLRAGVCRKHAAPKSLE